MPLITGYVWRISMVITLHLYMIMNTEKTRRTSMSTAYEKSGVNVEAGYEVVERIKAHTKNRAFRDDECIRWIWWLL